MRRRTRPRLTAAAAPLLLTASTLAQPGGRVIVALDMDPSRPGIQSSIDVPAGTTVVQGIAVYIYESTGTASMVSIGYLGGLDRGIALGHSPWPASQQGQVTAIVGQTGTPVNPGSAAMVTCCPQKGFVGPEIQYLEAGAPAPAVIASSPVHPVLTATVHLSGAQAGDIYHIALLDMVTVWRGGEGGAFSPAMAEALTTGGDSIPDSTHSFFGIDPDTPVPVPPAAFLVDYVDGGGPGGQTTPGGAVIRVGMGCWANCDGSSIAPILNIDDFTCFINTFAQGSMHANCDGSTVAPVLNVDDFTCFINAYAAGCP